MSILKNGYDIGKDLGLWKKLSERLQVLLRKKKKRILVLGASGAGKTKFVDSVADPFSEHLAHYQRTFAVEKRRASVEGSPFVMIDTPGQVYDEAKRKKAIVDAMKIGVEGIINVVCYGYHEAAEGDRDAAISKTRVGNPVYLKERRNLELALLSEWVPLLSDKKTRWVLTLVSKADLWWPEREQVEAYYRQGEYATKLLDLKKIHAVAPYCSVISPFYGTRTSGYFGDLARAQVRKHLLESVIRLTGVER